MPAPKVPRPSGPPLTPDVVESRRAVENLERELIFGCIKSYRFWQSIKDTVAPWNAEQRTHRLDFSVDRYNSLWHLVSSFYQRFANSVLEKDIYIPAPVITARVIDACNRNALPQSLAEQLVAEIAEETALTESLTLDSLTALAQSPAFNDWLSSRILEQTTGVIASRKSLGMLTLENLETMVAAARSSAGMSRTNTMVNGASFIRGTRRILPVVNLDNAFPTLCKLMGGGFYWGDSTMIAGINASGKTVIACQLADAFAELGYNTVYITTERRPDELFIRSVSNRLSVELSKLTANEGLRSNEEIEVNYIPDFVWRDAKMTSELLHMEQVYNQNLLYIDWSKGQGNSIKTHFDPLMQQIEATGWIPQVVIFDWIGGGLDAMQNKDWLRLYYQDAADHLINHGKKTKRIMIMFAQLDKGQVKGSVSQVTMSMLSECKTMTNNLTNWIGLTSLRDRDTRAGQSVIRRNQNLCLDKATRGITGSIVPVEMVFQFQRVAEAKEKKLAGGG